MVCLDHPSGHAILVLSDILVEIYRGTKGDTTVKDLGKASKTKNADGKEVLEVSLPTRPEDIDELWSGMRKELATPHVQEKSKRSADTKQADHYATVRTNTLLVRLLPIACSPLSLSRSIH